MSEYDVLINKYDALNAGYDQLYPKPMKHANTHASDGTDPITPSDIGAYSKNETYSKTEADTLLQKKAPAGFGYDGANSPILPLNSFSGDTIDDKLTTLFNSMTDESAVQIYLHDTSFSGYEMYGTLYKLSNYHGGYATAVFNGYDNYAGVPVTVRKVLAEGVWGPYEYFTPPMYIGVEYRTTERHLGKPVYVKTLYFGALPNTSTKNLNTLIPVAHTIIDRSVYTRSNSGYAILDLNRFETEDKLIVGSDYWVYYITDTIDFSTYINTYVTFKYTKD